MCRLLGVVAVRPAPLTELLAADLPQFLALACEHKDGWGVAYRDEEGLIQSYKDTASAENNDVLMKKLGDTVTDMAVLHLRMASPGSPIELGNTHPFGDVRAAFAHNGQIEPATCLDDLIGPDLLEHAEGETDSERFFLAVRHRLDQGETPVAALSATSRDIHQRARSVISLNSMLLTPEALYAYTEHDPDSEVIGRRGPGFFGLKYRQSPEITVVASQGWPQPTSTWATIPEQGVLKVPSGPGPAVVHES